MNLRNRIAMITLASSALVASAAGMAATGVTPASASTCKTTYPYSYKSNGAAFTQYWEIKVTCGTGTYHYWEHSLSRTTAGTVTDAHTYKSVWPVSHYWQHVDSVSVNRAGKTSYLHKTTYA